MSRWRTVFIGPPRYWLMWPVILAVLYLAGRYGLHVRHFVPFSFLVLGLAAAAVAFVLATARPGEQVTREPFPEED